MIVDQRVAHLVLCCFVQGLFASSSQDNNMFNAEQVRNAFDRSGREVSARHQGKGIAELLPTAEPAVRLEPVLTQAEILRTYSFF